MDTIIDIIKNNLRKCSIEEHLTDKALYHSYDIFYSEILEKYYDKEFNILEIGVGQGGGLKWLHDTFKKACIYGIDHDFSNLEINKDDYERIILLPECDQRQIDISVLPKLDVIIDDCSHQYINSMQTFYLLKNTLNDDGIYIIEDIYPEFLNAYIELGYFEVFDYRENKGRQDDVCLVFRNK